MSMSITIRFLVSLLIVFSPMLELRSYANKCDNMESEVEFDRNKEFSEIYSFIWENSGMLKKATLPFSKLVTDFVVKQKCVNCSKFQFRAKVSQYLNQPYLFANYLVALASAGGLMTTLFATPETPGLGTWWGKLAASTMLLAVSAYTGSNLQSEFSQAGRQSFYKTKVIADARKTFPGFDRIYVAEAREASFSSLEQGMEFPVSRAVSFLHGAASYAYNSIFSPTASAKAPARYFAQGMLNLMSFHPEFLFSMNNRGQNAFDFAKDTTFDSGINMLFVNAIMSEFSMKLFYAGQLKSMQPYFETQKAPDQIFDYNVADFRAEILNQIKITMTANNLPPMTAQAEVLVKNFLVRTILHPKQLISKFQLDKPKGMTDTNWRKYLEDSGFAIVDNDPYVNDRTESVTAYSNRIVNAKGERLDSDKFQEQRRTAEKSQFVYFFKNAN